MASSDEERVHPVFRPVRRVVNAGAIEAKRRRRDTMIQDGYTEWQMARAEAQRVTDQVGDGEGVTQSVFRCTNTQTGEPEPEPMNERVNAVSDEPGGIEDWAEEDEVCRGEPDYVINVYKGARHGDSL